MDRCHDCSLGELFRRLVDKDGRHSDGRQNHKRPRILPKPPVRGHVEPAVQASLLAVLPQRHLLSPPPLMLLYLSAPLSVALQLADVRTTCVYGAAAAAAAAGTWWL